MSDVIGVNSALPTRIGGVNSSTSLPDYFADVDSTAHLFVVDKSNGPVAPGTAATTSSLSGGQYNSAGVTLTNTQQSAFQLNSSGALIVTSSGSTFSGTLTNNNAAPAANNLGVLPALAEGTLSASRYVSGNQVLPIVDLAGNTNVDLQYYLGAAVSKTNPIATTISDGTNVITAAISAYGTAPTGTEVMGVNSYITNAPTVNQGTPNTLANAWASKLTDGTNGPVAVKPANTAPTVTDPALVVTISPNSPSQSYISGNGTIAALNANVVAPAGGAINWDITGTWVGTLTTQATNGDGSWINVASLSNQSGLITNSTTINGTLEMNAAGWIQVRLIATAWTSGTANVTWSSTPGSHVIIAYQGNAANMQTTAYLEDGVGNPISSASNNNPTPQQLLSVQVPNTSITPVALGALNASVSISAAGLTSVGFQMAAGTFIGTITPQCSVDGGTSWVTCSFLNPVTGGISSSYTFTTANTLIIMGVIPVGGSTNVRVTVTAYTSGTANCLLSASQVTANTSQSGSIQGSGTVTALNQSVIATTAGYGSSYFDITGTWVGSLTFQAQNGDGNWYNIYVYFSSTGSYASSTATANTTVQFNCAGYTQSRVIATAWTSGTAVISWNAAAYPHQMQIYNPNSAANILVSSYLFDGVGNAISSSGGSLLVKDNSDNVIGAATGTTVSLTGGAVTTAAPTYVTATANALSLKTTGDLRVDSVIADNYLSQIATNTSANATDFTTIGTITALNGTVLVYGQGVYTVTASITGTWVGTLVMEGQAADNNWYGLDIYSPSNNITPFTTTITTNGLYGVVGGGFLNIRVRASAYTSGTVNVALDGSLAQQSILAGQLGTWTSTVTQATASNLNAQIQGPAASGAAVSGNPVLIGASDGTDVRTLQVNPVNNGIESLLVQNNENLRQTYSVGVGGSSFPAIAGAPTDVFILNGSATKTIRIINIQFSMTATTAVLVPVQLIKRSAANVGGTAGSATITPHDSNDSAATATNLFYTANATTLGATVGTMIRSASYLATTSTTNPQQILSYSFGQDGGQPIVLRGVAQGLAINLNGVTIAGGKLDMSVTWTEDNS